MTEDVVYRTLAVTDDVRFEIAINPADSDALSSAIAEGTYTFSTSFRALFELMRPGAYVLDLGGHIGTFALTAAALGCRVLTVEASPRNASLLRASIARNGFDQVTLVCAAVSDRPGTVDFYQAGPYGFVVSGSTDRPLVRVPAVTVDALLAEHGWNKVDLLKLDIEGSEVAALQGMSGLLSRPDAPPILVESNAHTLEFFGKTPHDLSAALTGHGYSIYQIEPQQLVPLPVDHLQLECVTDLLAAKEAWPLPDGWRIGPAPSLEDTIARAAGLATHPHEHYRGHLARTLAQAGDELLDDRQVRLALDALAADPHADVRAAAAWWLERRERRPPAEQAGLDPLPDLSSLEAPDLDAEAVMQHIRERLRARRAEARARGLDVEALADGLYPLPPGAILSRDVYEAVRALGLGWDKVGVEMALTENRLPLVGPLVQRLRAALHELVLFYLNRQAARQARVNEQTARALAALVRDLEAEIAALRARLAELEARGEAK